MLNMLRRLIGEDIELIATLAPALGKVLIDPGQIEQVIVNLVVNARDAIPNGGRIVIRDDRGRARRAVRRGAHRREGGASCSSDGQRHRCRDEQGDSARMFEPFFTTKEVGKGTGLGLATVSGSSGRAAAPSAYRASPAREACCGSTCRWRIEMPSSLRCLLRRAAPLHWV